MNERHNDPLITVYMPTCNRVDLLKRAVESVIDQDYKNFELIVVDDNSTDDTQAYLESICNTDSRVRYIRNTSNLGACASRNKAISCARGEFITGLDDDDYFLQARLSTFVKAWEHRGDGAIALCTTMTAKLADGRTVKTKRPRTIKRKDLIDYNLIGNQVFTKTKYMIDAGGFDEDLPAWHDLDCWYRLMKDGASHVECIGNHSYVADVSHPHERISSSRLEKIQSAYSIFSEKNKLTDVERRILSLQLTTYHEKTSFPLSIILRKLIRNPTYFNLKQSARLTLRSLYHRIK